LQGTVNHSLGTPYANGLLEPLLEEIKKHNPNALPSLNALTSMPPKAYRWVGEMEEVSHTFAKKDLIRGYFSELRRHTGG
jgi:Domain of unknown function (DUF1932)